MIRAATNDLIDPPSLLSDEVKFDVLNSEMVKLKDLHQSDVARLDAENKELRSQLKSAGGKRSELEQALIITTNSMKVRAFVLALPTHNSHHPCLYADRAK